MKVNPVGESKKRKQPIPKAVKEQLWLRDMGKIFEGKCKVPWCKNIITIFDFHCGHNIPESKGGSTTLDNLIAICSRCNTSMGNNYTINEWSDAYKPGPITILWKKFICCFV